MFRSVTNIVIVVHVAENACDESINVLFDRCTVGDEMRYLVAPAIGRERASRRGDAGKGFTNRTCSLRGLEEERLIAGMDMAVMFGQLRCCRHGEVGVGRRWTKMNGLVRIKRPGHFSVLVEVESHSRRGCKIHKCGEIGRVGLRGMLDLL